jgi:undecaprenyl-diphosphatase
MILGLIWKDWKSGLFIMASLAIQTSVVTITKRIAVRARPPHLTAHKLMTSGSYPSGHSASTMTMALLVPAMLMPYLPFWAVILVVVYFLTNAIVTAYGRLYLDMHWATDIIGGWVLSVITFFVVIYLMGIS